MNEDYYRAIHNIIKAGHRITDQVSMELKEFDITEPQFNVLRILKGQRGQAITVQEIQSKMVQRSSNVTRIIDKLLAKQLVLRQECASNRRKMDITITPTGLDLLEKLDRKVHIMHKPMFSCLDSEEAKTLTELTSRLIHQLDN